MESQLIRDIEVLKTKLKGKVKYQLEEFNVDKTNKEKVFVELCFCILVANNSMTLTKVIWEKIGKGFLTFSREELSKKLESLRYRYYIKRAEYIVEAREKIGELVNSLKLEETETRLWLVETIRGIGFKEASHFLRNIGYRNFAILDRHVLRVMKNYDLIEEVPKTLTKKKYLEFEKLLSEVSTKLNISMAELDLYLFYLQTERICIK